MRNLMQVSILIWFLCIFVGGGSRYLQMWLLPTLHHQSEVLGKGKCSNKWWESVLIWRGKEKTESNSKIITRQRKCASDMMQRPTLTISLSLAQLKDSSRRCCAWQSHTQSSDGARDLNHAFHSTWKTPAWMGRCCCSHHRNTNTQP